MKDRAKYCLMLWMTSGSLVVKAFLVLIAGVTILVTPTKALYNWSLRLTGKQQTKADG